MREPAAPDSGGVQTFILDGFSMLFGTIVKSHGKDSFPVHTHMFGNHELEKCAANVDRKIIRLH